MIFIILTVSLLSCEYFESPDDTAAVQKGLITFPAVTLNGERYVTMPVGGAFEDPGVVATLGTDDISEQVVVDGAVDPSVADVYVLTYTATVTNELGEESSASQERFVAVVSESVQDVDLSGTYNGDGTAVAGTWNQAATVTPISGAWYRIDKALASGNNLGMFFALVGGGSNEAPEKIVAPNQPSPFGPVNTTAAGASGELTDNGFQWTIFVGCCGLFGPIIFSK